TMHNHNHGILEFNELFSKYQKRFVFFASSYLKDGAAAEDVVMESFLYYWENRENLKPDSNIPAYILKIIKNKSLNQLRAKNIRLKANEKINHHNLRVLQTQ